MTATYERRNGFYGVVTTGPRGGKRWEMRGWVPPANLADAGKLLEVRDGQPCPRCGGTEYTPFPQTFTGCVPCENECFKAVADWWWSVAGE